MPLGLPNHLAPHSITIAYARGSHLIAAICILLAVVTTVGIQSGYPELTLWPALVALVPLAACLAFLDRRTDAFRSAAYLLIGGASVYWYAVTGAFEYSAAASSDSYLLTLAKLSLMFVGAGRTAPAMIGWAIAGFACAELSVGLAAIQAGGVCVWDGATIASLAAIIGAVSVIWLTRRHTVRTQSSFTRATREEHVSAVRFRIEGRAAAIMHDTVLGHLAAISSAQPGPLPAELRAQMQRDLEVLIGEEWLLDSDLPDSRAGADWRESALFTAINEARQLGLDVEVSGDVNAISRLERRTAQAVALAAKQCLINVVRHAGVDNAEVVIYGTDTEVSVMIIDSGRGFSESETGADRLGLRQSVRQRIAEVDGDVQVWSTPGRGTSVMIRVPARADEQRETEVDG